MHSVGARIARPKFTQNHTGAQCTSKIYAKYTDAQCTSKIYAKHTDAQCAPLRKHMHFLL